MPALSACPHESGCSRLKYMLRPSRSGVIVDYMDRPTDDDILLEMIATVAADVLDHIGDDRELRYQFFRSFMELARKTVDRQPVH